MTLIHAENNGGRKAAEIFAFWPEAGKVVDFAAVELTRSALDDLPDADSVRAVRGELEQIVQEAADGGESVQDLKEKFMHRIVNCLMASSGYAGRLNAAYRKVGDANADRGLSPFEKKGLALIRMKNAAGLEPDDLNGFPDEVDAARKILACAEHPDPLLAGSYPHALRDACFKNQAEHLAGD